MLSYGLENKVILVTGGTRGIGLETARELLRQKAKVVICARKQPGLDAAVQELDGGANLLALQAHIAQEDDVISLFKNIMDHFGRLDVLINNVGMNLMSSEITQTELAQWQKIIDTNLGGTFLVSRQAARIMQEQGSGRIVTVSSIAAHLASAGMNIYGVAKAAMEMLTKVLAAELAPHGITVNAVAPAMVRTDFSKPFWSKMEIHEKIIQGIPLGRIAEIDEVVQPVLFLASDGASFITGQTLMVDGGSTIA